MKCTRCGSSIDEWTGTVKLEDMNGVLINSVICKECRRELWDFLNLPEDMYDRMFDEVIE